MASAACEQIIVGGAPIKKISGTH